jgi:predicted dehydrogenase
VLRAAILGCGAIGGGNGTPHPDVGVMTHAGAYAASPDTELVAVCDSDGERARECARRWGARPYTEASELLASEAPKIVSVATPNHTHAALVELCLRTGGVRAVLAEKPLALAASEARALTALARERRVVLAVNYTRRFVPAFGRLREELAAGALGELQHVSGVYVNGLTHNGTHWLDLLRMLAGEPVSVRGWDRLGEGGDDPTLDAELTLGSGAGVRLAGLDARCFTAFEMGLVGTRGSVRVLESGHVVEWSGVGDDPRHPGYRALRPRSELVAALRDGTLHAVADVVRCLREGGEPACGGDDAVASLELAAAIRASAVHGGHPIAAGRGLPSDA